MSDLKTETKSDTYYVGILTPLMKYVLTGELKLKIAWSEGETEFMPLDDVAVPVLIGFLKAAMTAPKLEELIIRARAAKENETV